MADVVKDPNGTPEVRFPTRGPRAEGEAAPIYDIAPGTAFKRKYLVWVRRFSQVFFLALFMWMVARTEFTGSFTDAAMGEETIKLGEPVAGFLWFDPLVAMGTAIASHSLYKELLFALGLLVATMLVGRFFCGWICPFGTLHQFFSWVAPSRKGKLRIDRNVTHKYQQVKYYILLAMGVAALFGALQVGLLDPICVMVRSTGLFVLPAAAHAARAGARVLYETNTGAGIWVGDLVSNAVPTVLPAKEYSYHYIWILGSLFVGFLLMNRFITRFWCRAICPLGALLGVSSKWAIYGMEKDHDKCTDCNLCILHCQGAADPQGGVKWNVSECHLCFNCENLCPDDVITFKFFPRQKSIQPNPVNVTRRRLLTATAGAALAVPMSRIGDMGGPDRGSTNYRSDLIRPPGSLPEPQFLERCIKCAECMKVCPNNALHPAMLEGGLEGMWTPVLIPRIGYCEHSCTLCGEVCPTGAIQRITEDQKVGRGMPPIKLGTAFYDHGRCLPWSMATPCIVCEEFCPTSPKSIYVDLFKAVDVDGKEVEVKRPYVDPDLCIGCGACEKVCPIMDRPAVYVTSVGESRSKTNIILLENTAYGKS